MNKSIAIVVMVLLAFTGTAYPATLDINTSFNDLTYFVDIAGADGAVDADGDIAVEISANTNNFALASASATISGGDGGAGSADNPGAMGAAGISITSGGDGTSTANNVEVFNDGTILGGNGGAGGVAGAGNPGQDGGDGSDAVIIDANFAIFTNTNIVTGGSGGAGSDDNGGGFDGDGGWAGVGVRITADNVVINNNGGTITGGSGGLPGSAVGGADAGSSEDGISITGTANNVTINNTGTIQSGTGGGDNASPDGIEIESGAGHVIVNSGSIIAYVADGIDLDADATSITNQAGGIIRGAGSNSSSAGVDVQSGTLGLLDNSGTIESTDAAGGPGVDVDGTVTDFQNRAGGIISSVSHIGIDVAGTIGTLNNAGMIKTTTTNGGEGIYVDIGATIDTLANSGTITSENNDGIEIDGQITSLTNEVGGVISSTNAASFSSEGIDINAGAMTLLSNGGTVSAVKGDGIHIGSAVTIASFVNNGTIESTETADGNDGVTVNGMITSFANNASGIIRTLSSSSDDYALYVHDGMITTLTNSGNISSLGGDGIHLSGNSVIGTLNNTGTIQSVNGASALYVDTGSEIGSLNNAGGTLLSNGTSATFVLAEDQDAALTNAGTIQNTGGGAVMLITMEGQTSNDFTNTGTMSADAGLALHILSPMTGSLNGFVNSGTIYGAFGALNAESSVRLTNTGMITGDITHLSSGVLEIFQNGGSITGNISSTVSGAHSITVSGGSITGDINLNGGTGVTYTQSGGTVTGNIDLRTGSMHTVSLTGGTINGYLEIGDTAGSTIDINTASTVTLDADGDTVLAGEATTITKSGAGMLILDGDVRDTVDGDNDIVFNHTAGSVRFDDATTNIMGTFTATGTSTTDFQDNTVTVRNNASFGAMTTLGFTIGDINGQLRNNTDTSITLTDGATIALTRTSLLGNGTQITLVDATGSGGGSNLVAMASNLALSESDLLYSYTLSQIADTLVLTLSNASIPGLSEEEQIIFDNAQEAFLNDPELAAALSGINDLELLQSILNTLKLNGFDGTLSSNLGNNAQILNALYNRINHISSNGEHAHHNLWAEYVRHDADQDARGNSSGYKTDTNGVVIGWDKQVTQDNSEMIIGVSYGYTDSDVNVKGGTADVDIDSHTFSAYAYIEKNDLFYDGFLNYGLNQNDSTRHIAVASAIRTAEAEYDSHVIGTRHHIGLLKDIGGGIVARPVIGLQYQALITDEYTEDGAGAANLHVDVDTYHSLKPLAGLSLQKEDRFNDYLNYFVKLRGFYFYETMDTQAQAQASFVGGSAFSVNGLNSSEHLFRVGATLALKHAREFELTFDYDADIQEDYLAHTFVLRAKKKF